MTDSDTLRIMAKIPGEKFAGVIPTSAAISPTRELTESKTPVRLPMIPLIRSSLSHSVMVSRILLKLVYLFLSSGVAGRLRRPALVTAGPSCA